MNYTNENDRDELVKKVIDGAKKHARKALLAGLVGFTALSSIKTTGTTEIGVKTTTWSPFGSGVQQEVYAPGSTQFVMPYFQEWSTLNVRAVPLEMTGKLIPNDYDDTDNQLKFKAKDGNDIFLDMNISYRIDPQKGPYIISNVAQSDEELREKIVIPVIRSKVRDIFGALGTEEFYNAVDRAKASEKAKEELQKIFTPYGVIIEKVDPKQYSFNDAYQKAVSDKKNAEVNILKLESEQQAQAENNKKLLAEAESNFNQKVAQANGDYKQTVVAADAYFNQQQNLAKAITAEGRNMADGIKEKRIAMTTVGGATSVKMAYVEALIGKPIVMVPYTGPGSLNMFDVNAFLGYAMQKKADQQDK